MSRKIARIQRESKLKNSHWIPIHKESVIANVCYHKKSKLASFEWLSLPRERLNLVFVLHTFLCVFSRASRANEPGNYNEMYGELKMSLLAP